MTTYIPSKDLLSSALAVIMIIGLLPAMVIGQENAQWDFEYKFAFTDAEVPVGTVVPDIELFELDQTPTSLYQKCQEASNLEIPILLVWNSESCNRAWDIATSLIGPIIDQHGSDVLYLEVALANEVHQTGSNELNFWADINGSGDTVYLDPQASQVTPGGFNIPQTQDWNGYADWQQERSYRLVNNIECYTSAQMNQIEILLETADESMADKFGGPSGAAILNPATKEIIAKVMLPGECNENGQCILDINTFNYALDSVEQHLDNILITSDRSPASAPEILIFPNPSNGVFEVNFGSPLQGGNVTVYDEMGRLVWQGVTVEDRIRINLEHLPSGVYSMQIADATGMFAINRIAIL